MHRFYQKISPEVGSEMTIEDKGLAHQLIRVLRMKSGDEITFFNGSGSDFLCEITDLSKKSVNVKVLSESKPETERKVKVHLYQAVPHTWSKFEDVLKKCTELGVVSFNPVLMERCETRVKAGDDLPKRDRLERIVVEACEQCGGSFVPEIEKIVSFEDALASAPGMKIMAYELEDKVNIGEIDISGEVSLFVGPEGGITEGEAEDFSTSGGFLFNLGKRILRTETAPVAVVGRIVL